MGCLNWCQVQPSVSHPSSSPQTLASVLTSHSSKRPSPDKFPLRVERCALFGSTSSTLCRSRSCELPKLRTQTIKRSCSANLDHDFSDEEFSKTIQELALKFQLSDEDNEEENASNAIDINFVENQNPFHSSKVEPVEPPDWHEINPASLEMKANSVSLPLSLRIIKKKKQWQQGVREVGESAYCSMKKAFSSMVFIIRELQCYSLQMRGILFLEDLQDILVRVQKEMNASFVWLFQQVFSHTPTLMVYVMILLANYSVYSMANNPAIAATSMPHQTISVMVAEDDNIGEDKFDSSAIKTFSVSSSNGKTTSIGGNSGGGGKFPVIGSGTEGDGKFDASDYHRTIFPDGSSSVGSHKTATKEESVSGQVSVEEESSLWNSIVEEASRMQAVVRDEYLNQQTTPRFVSPVTAKIEADDYEDYFRTELLYQTSLVQDPTSSLLLANYAQFLFLVLQDYDRAEEYFKRAVKVEPKDAESLSKYASFLWKARQDLWAAEETYLEAISIDPTNSYYAANYAHFLWSTGGEDTCYPLNSSDTNNDDVY